MQSVLDFETLKKNRMLRLKEAFESHLLTLKSRKQKGLGHITGVVCGRLSGFQPSPIALPLPVADISDRPSSGLSTWPSAAVTDS